MPRGLPENPGAPAAFPPPRPRPARSMLPVLLCAAFVLTACAARIPAAPAAAFLGLSTEMPLTDARHSLKSQGYIITGRDSDGPLHRISYTARDLGAVFATVEILSCASTGEIAGIYFSGDAREAILSAARSQLELTRVNTTPVAPAAATGEYRPGSYSLYRDAVKVALFAVADTGIYGISLERPDVKSACQGSKQDELKAERTLFLQIREELRRAGVSSFIAKSEAAPASPPGIALPRPGNAATAGEAAHRGLPLTQGTREAAGASGLPGLEPLPAGQNAARGGPVGSGP